MRFALFVFATIAALVIYGRWSNPPTARPYAVVVPIDRRPPLRVEVYEKYRPPPPFKPGPRIMDMGLDDDT